VIADAQQRGVAGRHHGRRRHRGVDDTRTSTSRPPSGGPRPLRAVRAATTSAPTPATASSAASTRTTVEHIERITQLIVDICGGQAGPMDDHVLNLPQAQPVTLRVARAAKVIGMPLTQAQCAEVFLRRLGLPVHRRRGRAHRDAAELALRPADRGRPDRGGDPRHRLRPAAHTPPLAPVHGTRAPRGAAQRLCTCAPRWRRWTTRRRSTSASSSRAGSTTGRQRRPDRVLNPIAAPLAVMRSSLLGSLVQVLRHNLARKAAACACSRSAASSCATPQCGRRPAVGGRRGPAHARGRAGLRQRRPAAVGAREQGADFYD
jgi:phenylalanyl-tRNA synthetase beta chain